jgi:thymidylate synthase
MVTLHIYYKHDENPSLKNTRHVEANVNTLKENQNNQNNSNEMEDVMLKGYPLPQIN